MEKQYFKNYQFIFGICVLLAGILVSAFLSSPLRYLGFVFVAIAVLYFAIVMYLNMKNSDDSKFRSRTREQILRRQYKK